MATRKKTTSEAAVNDETMQQAAAEKTKQEETKEVAAEFDKGQTYAAKDVMPLYDKIGGQQIATVYKHNRVTVKSTKKASGIVWIETEAGFVAGKDEAGNIYFS